MINTRGVRDWLRLERLEFYSLLAPSRSSTFLPDRQVSLFLRLFAIGSPTAPAVKVVKFKLPRARHLDG